MCETWIRDLHHDFQKNAKTAESAYFEKYLVAMNYFLNLIFTPETKTLRHDSKKILKFKLQILKFCEINN